jgi:hypothetical protein
MQKVSTYSRKGHIAIIHVKVLPFKATGGHCDAANVISALNSASIIRSDCIDSQKHIAHTPRVGPGASG